jgi:hypothetical protein
MAFQDAPSDARPEQAIAQANNAEAQNLSRQVQGIMEPHSSWSSYLPSAGTVGDLTIAGLTGGAIGTAAALLPAYGAQYLSEWGSLLRSFAGGFLGRGVSPIATETAGLSSLVFGSTPFGRVMRIGAVVGTAIGLGIGLSRRSDETNVAGLHQWYRDDLQQNRAQGANAGVHNWFINDIQTLRPAFQQIDDIAQNRQR